MFEGVSRLERSPESRFWIGTDVKMEKNLDLPAKGLAVYENVVVKKDQLPPVEEISPLTSFSIRSVLAQLGLEISMGTDDWRRARAMAEDSSNGEANLQVVFMNHGHRGIRMEKGDDIFRFYKMSREGRYEGKNLVSYVMDSGMVDGEYGKDWWFIDWHGEMVPDGKYEEAVMICFPFDSEKKLWVPPAEEPIHLKNRAELEKHIEPMPEGLKTDFYVSETLARVRMKGRPGTLLSGVEDDTGHWQTQSHLIDPYFGDKDGGKPIRVEIFDPASLSHQKPYVYMHLWPAVGEEK